MLMLGQMRVRLMLIEVQNEREKDATDRQMQTGGLNCEIKKSQPKTTKQYQSE